MSWALFCVPGAFGCRFVVSRALFRVPGSFSCAGNFVFSWVFFCPGRFLGVPGALWVSQALLGVRGPSMASQALGGVPGAVVAPPMLSWCPGHVLAPRAVCSAFPCLRRLFLSWVLSSCPGRSLVSRAFCAFRGASLMSSAPSAVPGVLLPQQRTLWGST